jgi:hypothetical protein
MTEPNADSVCLTCGSPYPLLCLPVEYKGETYQCFDPFHAQTSTSEAAQNDHSERTVQAMLAEDGDLTKGL